MGSLNETETTVVSWKRAADKSKVKNSRPRVSDRQEGGGVVSEVGKRRAGGRSGINRPVYFATGFERTDDEP